MPERIIEIKELGAVQGIVCVEALVRYPSGETACHTMYKSAADFKMWLWSVKDRLTVAEAMELEQIIEQMKIDAISEQDID